MSEEKITMKRSEFEAALQQVISEYAESLKTAEEKEIERLQDEVERLRAHIQDALNAERPSVVWCGKARELLGEVKS